jgi:hypothetical protein
VDQLARRYVRREGRPRDVMRHIIGRAVISESAHPQFRVLGVATVAVWVNAPLADGDPLEWTHAKRLPQAATMIARLGSGQCLHCGCNLANDGLRRRYCALHEQEAAYSKRADREAILALLNGAGDALGVKLTSF